MRQKKEQKGGEILLKVGENGEKTNLFLSTALLILAASAYAGFLFFQDACRNEQKRQELIAKASRRISKE